MNNDPESWRSWMEHRQMDEAFMNVAGRRVWFSPCVLVPPGSPASPPLSWRRGDACLYRWSSPSSLTWAQTSHEPPGVRLIDINHQHSKVGLQRLLEGAQSLSYGAEATSVLECRVKAGQDASSLPGVQAGSKPPSSRGTRGGSSGPLFSLIKQLPAARSPTFRVRVGAAAGICGSLSDL